MNRAISTPEVAPQSTAEFIGYSEWRPTRCIGYDTWLGDDIGCSSGKPARIHLRDQFGQQQESSVRNVLLRAGDMNAYGLGRVVSALRLFSGTGELHPDDLAAWRAVEDEFPICSRIGKVL